MMLAIKGVNKRFGRRRVLHDIDLELGEGVYGLLGENGAGKTTLIRCLCALYKTDGGSVLYDGRNVMQSGEYRMRMGYLPQAFALFKELTVYEMLDYFCTIKQMKEEHKEQAIMESLRRVNLEDRVKDRIGALSGGMTRRVGIAQTLLGDVTTLLYDEPTSGLDPEERLRFKNMIHDIKQGKCILISTHIVQDIEALCDQVIVIHQGRILFCGTRQELRERAQGKVYQVPTEDTGRLREGYYLLGQGEREGLTRVLSGREQDAERAGATIEDGYMSLLKGL